jgi:hypothetical protein
MLKTNNSITELDISENRIDDTDKHEIVSALESNISITSLNISGNYMSYDAVDSIKLCFIKKWYAYRIIGVYYLNSIIDRNVFIKYVLRRMIALEPDADMYEYYNSQDRNYNVIDRLGYALVRHFLPMN